MRRFQVAPEVLSEEVEGTVLLIDSGSHELVTLNVTGSIVWAALAEADLTVSELVEMLVAEFPGAPRAELERDVETFLSELTDLGLIVSGE